MYDCVHLSFLHVPYYLHLPCAFAVTQTDSDLTRENQSLYGAISCCNLSKCAFASFFASTIACQECSYADFLCIDLHHRRLSQRLCYLVSDLRREFTKSATYELNAINDDYDDVQGFRCRLSFWCGR